MIQIKIKYQVNKTKRKVKLYLNNNNINSLITIIIYYLDEKKQTSTISKHSMNQKSFSSGPGSRPSTNDSLKNIQ